MPPGDYVSPNFRRIRLDAAFPHMVAGDPARCGWEYLRPGPHTWYCDSRMPGVGFLSRDEAHILYNTALDFAGRAALEVGCFMGWSAAHMAAAGVRLDVIDPLLNEAMVRESVIASLTATGGGGGVRLHPARSPEAVAALGRQGQVWSLIFIDGDHSFPAPVRDAVACERYAATDALILMHDLNAPAVAEGLYYLRDRGWNVRLYHTAQIMGVAWRGAAEPVAHIPDPTAHWPVPQHLQDLT
jgi:predicted O-methyltransferase YrrM